MIYWLLFILSSTICEAFFYNVKNPDLHNKINEHFFLNAMRLIVFCGLFHDMRHLDLLYTAISASITFPFLHDTLYYLVRYLLDNTIYPNWYWTHSNTSTAISDRFLTAPVRLVLFIIGISIYIFI